MSCCVESSRSYLDWRENALSRCDGRDEGDDEGDQVDGQLELQEFSDRIVYVSAPHDSSNDGSKVVIQQDNVTGLLSNISTAAMTN